MRYNLFASKRYCLYNRTAKTTVQLQHFLETNVKAKRKSNKESIYNWNDNGRYNVDDSKRDENDQQKNSSSKKLFNNLLEKQPFDQMIWTSLTIKLKPTRLKAFFLDKETAKRSSEKLD